MSESERFIVGDPMPKIAKVVAERPFRITVEWDAGNHNGSSSVVDLAPIVLSMKVFAPLRTDEALFASVHTIEGGRALAWGEDENIDIAATTVERLAKETMSSTDFAGFLRRNSLSLDAAAALLGIGRRVVAYYAKDRPVPRYIALACRYIEQNRAHRDSVTASSGITAASSGTTVTWYTPSGGWVGSHTYLHASCMQCVPGRTVDFVERYQTPHDFVTKQTIELIAPIFPSFPTHTNTMPEVA
jgi:hypothetical protein